MPDPGNGVQELPGVTRAQFGIPAGRERHQSVQCGRKPRHGAGRRRDDLVDVLVRHRQRGIAGMRLPAGEQLEEHHPGRVHVGACVGRPAGHLLGRQVGGGSDDHPGLGLARLDQQPGQPEIGDLDRTGVAEQHVLGLDVAMRDPGVVGRGQPAQHPGHDVQCLTRAEPATRVQQVAERPAGHVLHRQIQDVAVGPLVVHGDDVRVGELGDRPGLADKPADEVLVVGEPGVHDLERDRALEPRVSAQVNRGHAAAGDQGLDPVAPIEQLPDGWAREGRIHRLDSRGGQEFQGENLVKDSPGH